MKTSSAKAKGRRCAKEAKKIILKHLSTLQNEDVVITSSGETGEDLKLSPAARKILPFQFEAKNVEKINIWQALKQAKEHGPYIPVVVFKKNNQALQACLEFDTFMNIYALARVIIKKYEELQNENKVSKSEQKRLTTLRGGSD